MAHFLRGSHLPPRPSKEASTRPGIQHGPIPLQPAVDKPYYFRPCLICWLLFAHHKNRAVGVAHDGIGNATQQRSPYTAQVSATHNNETSTYLLRQSSNLRFGPSYSEMGLCHIASSGFDLPYLLVE